MKRSKGDRRVKVSADGQGVVSHAGAGLLREMAEYTGLVDGVTEALLDTYKGLPVHPPGRVFTDLAVAVADGADAISGIAVLADRQDLFGPVASMPTTWRVLDRIDAAHLPLLRAARAQARAKAWAAGAGPDLSASCGWISTPRSPSRTARRRTPRRPGSAPSDSTRCCVFSGRMLPSEHPKRSCVTRGGVTHLARGGAPRAGSLLSVGVVVAWAYGAALDRWMARPARRAEAGLHQ